MDTVTEVTPSARGCEECLRIGSPWVHLRLCRQCGHVGCCDDSPHRHATAHHRATGHPMIEGYDPPEGWGWCYIDEVEVDLPDQTAQVGPSPATSDVRRATRGRRLTAACRSHHLGGMDDLANLGLVDDADIVLDEAALALALLDHEYVDPTPYEDLLSDVASRLGEVGSGADSASDRAGCLARVLADEFGFTGDTETYDDPANADLIEVIDRLRGLPISLSILHVAAARRIGWSAEILNLPGHVLVMVGQDAAPVIMDPFRGGARVDVGGMAALLAASDDGTPAPVRHVAAMPNRAILVRLLLNQATRAERTGRGRRALELYGRMTAIAPEHPHPWWERARLELVDGDVAAARASLAAMLEITREPALRERVATKIASLPFQS